MGILDAPGLSRAEAVRNYQRAADPALYAFRAALANRDNAPVNIACLGDSITEGTGATVFTNRWASRLQKALRDRFPVAGAPGASPSHRQPIKISTATWTAPWTQAGTARTAATAGATTYGMNRANDAMSATGMSTSTTFVGTSFELHYAQDTAGAVMSVTIDGGTPTLVNTAGTGIDGGVWTSPALGRGTHTVVVAYDATSPASSILYFEGGFFYDGDETKGIRVWNGGHHGWNSSNFAGGSTGWYRSFRNTKADLLIVELGANDFTNGVTAATFQTNLTSLLSNLNTQIKAARTSNYPFSTVLLMVPERVTGGSSGFTATEPWANYVAAAKAVAAADPANVCVLDLGTRMPAIGNNPSPTGDVTNLGLWADTVHPSDKGHAYIADQVVAFLTSGMPTGQDSSALKAGDAVRTPAKTGYLAPGLNPSTIATLGSGNLRLQPIDLPAGQLTKIGLEVTAAGSAGCTLRLGIYADDGSGGYPGALVLDAGTIPGDAVAVAEITTNVSLAGGRYWVGAALQGAPATQPTVRTSTNPSVLIPFPTAATPAANVVLGFAQTSVTGALPGTFSTSVVNSSSVPRVFVKITH